MFNLGREGYLWNNHRALERLLANNGYLPSESINRFSLYQLRQPGAGDGLEGKFLAFRESKPEPNRVETAIFWTGSSLEKAVEALGKLPAKTLGETFKDKTFGYQSLGSMLAIGILAGSVTGSVEIGTSAAGIYLACKAAYSLLQSYLLWQSPMYAFSDYVKGRLALSRALEFTEIRVFF